VSSRRYSEFASRINIDAFEEAIGFTPNRTDGNNNDIGQCPDIWNLHKNGDTTGKFAIHRDKKVYHCWVCGGGSLLSFVMEWKSFDEGSAVRWLYQFASEDAISKEQFAEEVDRVLGDPVSTELALPYFNSKVLDRFSPAPPEWLQSRNISSEVANSFGVKYNAESERHSANSDYVGPSIIFPHFWNEKVVGWQSRWLDESRPDWIPKYTNTSDFPKETTIYNFNLFQDDVVVVCESVPTVLVLASIGVPAMATFGSSVSERQIALLKRFQQGLYIAPDNDGAGVKYLDTLYEGLERFIPLKLIEPVGDPDSGNDLADLDRSEIQDRISSAEYL
jgi:DNA primase